MPNSNTAAAAGFQNAEGYEKVMGRWSRRLAPLLIRFGGLSDGDRVLDVGCGTGSLTFTLPEIANVAGVTGIDLTEPYVEFARARNTDQRISFQQADARVLPFEENSFDRAFSMLVLQFIPDAARPVAEMCRVVRPSGTVTAAVWDVYGGNPHTRMIWDIATVLDPSLERPLGRVAILCAFRAVGRDEGILAARAESCHRRRSRAPPGCYRGAPLVRIDHDDRAVLFAVLELHDNGRIHSNFYRIQTNR
jgi:SAM-dependent methyltransferase